jgi:hypothetical protein
VSRGLAGVILALASLLVAATAVWLFRQRAEDAPREAAILGGAAPAFAAPAGEGTMLLFPGVDGQLHREVRDMELDGDVLARATQVVGALLEGPRTEGLLPLLPAGTELLQVIPGAPGVVYLDLRAPNDPQAMAMGSRQELVTVYGLVDSLVLNVPGLSAVGFLWSGTQALSFAGHVDTTVPLAADTSLVAEPTAATGGG